MQKLDPKRELKRLYAPSADIPTVVEAPDMGFLMIDGSGNPNTSPVFSLAVEALYSASYKLKFLLKHGSAALDTAVMPLEGLWWSEAGPAGLLDKDRWKWTLMIMQPDAVSAEVAQEALAQLAAKKSLAALARVRYERFHEGFAAQLLHVGPYATEQPTITRLHRFIAEQGYIPRGRHHEIYLSDPKRSAPARMRTIIRQPIG